MTIRRPVVAGSFYPSDKNLCRQQIETCLGDYHPPAEPDHVVSGIVPHAGWVFSGPTAAKVFKSIRKKASPETFLIFGGSHRARIGRAAMFAEGAWDTPCGTIAIDEELANNLLQDASDSVTADSSVHMSEHSIEVQVPFIQYFFPEAKILPILIESDGRAAQVGHQVGKIIAEQEKPIVIVGSTDLTHYGPRYWFTPFGVGSDALKQMKENDQRIIDRIVKMEAEEIVAEAEQHRNACGSGAIAATVAAARALGSTQGYLLEYVTSRDVMPEFGDTDAVGYAGIIF